jgi:hypothetical protein
LTCSSLRVATSVVIASSFDCNISLSFAAWTSTSACQRNRGSKNR